MIVAALVFEAGLCRDDPERILRMPLRKLLYWYDLSVGWRKEVAKVIEQRQQTQQQAQQRQTLRTFSR